MPAIYHAVVLLMALFSVPGQHAFAAETADLETSIAIGKAIYRDGKLPDGSALSGRIVNDVELSADKAACANCHKRSGLGSNEGATFAPPVSGDILFTDFRLKAHRLSRDPGTGTSDLDRPAYTRESLFDTLTSGVSNTGKTLEAIMPRYALSDQDFQHLYNYLQTLSAANAPGVTDETLHIATIIDAEAPDESAAFMQEILELYIEKLNAGSRHETRRAKHAPIQKEWKYESYRKYVLHVWRLSGDQGSWHDQLEQHYSDTPVFAVVSGISERPWDPVHDFCNVNEIPCLFPSTPLPKVDSDNHYTLYFSRGLTGEAHILAEHINNDPNSWPAGPVIQLHDSSAYGLSGHKLLQQKLDAPTRNRVVNIDLDSATARQLTEHLSARPALVIVWANLDADRVADSLKQVHPGSTVFVPYLLARSQAFTDFVSMFESKLYTAYPYIDPVKETRHLIRPLSWLRVNQIENKDNIVLGDTFTAVLLLSDAIRHVRSNFNREYVIELLEHMVDNAVVTSLYPRLSLGPEQRYASKGGYIMKLSGKPEAPLEAVSDWIVPAD